MKRGVLLILFLICNSSYPNSLPKNEWPFYSFQIDDYFRDSSEVENFKKKGYKSKKEIEAILCKHVPKNCKLDDHPKTGPHPRGFPDSYFLYRLTEIRSKPTSSSPISGFMLEAAGMEGMYLEIYGIRWLTEYELNSSFVMDLEGKRIKLVDFHSRGFYSNFSNFKYTKANLFFMASSVVPEPEQGVEKDYWIGLKDLNDSSKRMWFQRKTKVYNPKYSALAINSPNRDEYFKKLFEISPRIKELYNVGRFEFVDNNKSKFLHNPTFFIKAVDGDDLVLTFFDSIRGDQAVNHFMNFNVSVFSYGSERDISGAYFDRIGKNKIDNPINYDPESKEVMDDGSKKMNYTFFVHSNFPCYELRMFKNEISFNREPFFWFTRLAEKKYPLLEIKVPVANFFNGFKLKDGVSIVGFDSPLIFEPAIPDDEGADLLPVEIYLNFQKMIQNHHFARDMTMKERNDLLEEAKKMRLEYCKDRKFVP